MLVSTSRTPPPAPEPAAAAAEPAADFLTKEPAADLPVVGLKASTDLVEQVLVGVFELNGSVAPFSLFSRK